MLDFTIGSYKEWGVGSREWGVGGRSFHRFGMSWG